MSSSVRVAIGIGATGFLLIFLHWAASKFAPRSHGDPRLGTLGFWVWVGITALFVHFVLGPLDSGAFDVPDWVWAAMTLISIAFWACQRSGYLDRIEWLRESQHDHEEAWASFVGIFLGLVGPAVVSRLVR